MLAELQKMTAIYPYKGCVGARRKTKEEKSGHHLPVSQKESLRGRKQQDPAAAPQGCSSTAGVALLKPFCLSLAPKGTLLPICSLRGKRFSTAARVVSRVPQPLYSASAAVPSPSVSIRHHPGQRQDFFFPQCDFEELLAGLAKAQLGLHPSCSSSTFLFLHG